MNPHAVPSGRDLAARRIAAGLTHRELADKADVGRAAWLSRFRLAIRYERRADIHLAFTTLGCAIICLNQIRRFC